MKLEQLESELAQVVTEASSAFAAVGSEAILNQTKAQFLGKSGSIAGFMKFMRDVEPEQRPALGKVVNEAKARVEELLADRRNTIQRELRAHELASTKVDLTLPGRTLPVGAVHPLRQIEERMLSVFRSMGYAVAWGPDVETDLHNFECLNFPPNHPARDMQDTLLTKDGRLLRTHTSPVQIRTMLANEPPIRIASPGSVYRSDELDMTHSPAFHQVEGLVVDKGITMAHLRGTLEEFASRLFEKDVGVRLRPSYFPFTEPSVEVDIQCVFCGGPGCRVCSESGWIEILGAGMVDPNVLAAVGIDPDVYTGFAFGIGIERVAMLVHGIVDIRLFYENDLRFLQQFQ